MTRTKVNKKSTRYELVFSMLLETTSYWQTCPYENMEQKIYDQFFLFLEKNFPEDGLVVEDFRGKTARNEYTWFLDPIDGTSNMRTRVPLFSTAISLVAGSEELILSFIVDWHSQNIYVAFENKNYCYSWPSKTCDEITLCKDLSREEYVLIGRIFGHHSNISDLEEFQYAWWNLAVLSKSYRQLGSVAMQMLLDGWHRNILCLSLYVRWFDILAPLHFLKNWGYNFQLSDNRECLIVAYSGVSYPQWDHMVNLVMSKWRFLPSNTFNISR